MQISIKPICNWPIYLTASADERLACIMQTSLSLHYIIYESISCNRYTKLNYCQLPSYIHHSYFDQFLDTKVLQNSVATCLRCDKIYNDHFVMQSLLSPKVK